MATSRLEPSKVILTLLGAIIAIASTIFSDIELTRLEKDRASLESKIEQNNSLVVSAQYETDLSLHSFDHARTLMSLLEITSAVPYNAYQTVLSRTATDLKNAVEFASRACPHCPVDAKNDPNKDYFALVARNGAAYDRFASLIEQYQTDYRTFLLQISARNADYSNQVADLDRRTNRVRSWAILIQFMGIAVILAKDLFAKG